jgi:radical SAM protein with 4Fe4S-binding SPASM domain
LPDELMIAQIETNTFCNHRCWYCQNAHYKNPEPRVMSLGLFETILIEISTAFSKIQLKTISFASYNEPTLDPYFKERLKMLNQHGFSYWFITNGSRLTTELLDFLTHEKPEIDCFHINLPAIDPDEYHHETGAPGQDIFQIKENLASLFMNQRETGSPKTVVVHGKGDATHKKNFKRMRDFWKNYPVEVVYQIVMNRAGMLNHIAGPPIDHGTDQVWCTAKYFENLYIGVRGNLYLCCHDYYQKYSFGNIMDGSLSTLSTLKKRKNMLRKFTHDFCRHCPFAMKFKYFQLEQQMTSKV